MVNWCKDCALRLFNVKCHNLQGIGNPFMGNVIIIPNVDYDAYKAKDLEYSSQVKLITDILHISPTGGLDSNLYFLPLIRCNENLGCEITQDIVNRCTNYLVNDANKYNFKNIMLCGDAARRFLNIDDISKYLDTVICNSVTKRRYFINYSPLIKYKDEEKFEVFKQHLIKYYNSIVSKMYDYDIMIL